MRSLLCLICIFSSIIPGLAQTYLSDIFKLDGNFAIFTESVWDNDTLYVTGNSGAFPVSYKATIIKFAQNGSYISHVSLPDTSNAYNFGFWNKGLLMDSGTIVHTAAKGLAVDDEIEGMMIKADLNGNFLDSVSFKNFYSGVKLVDFRSFEKLTDGYVIAELSWKDHQNAQSCLLRLDESFNVVWRRCYGNESKEMPVQVFALSNGHFVVLSNSTDLDNTGIFRGSGNAYHRGYIFEVDADGNLVWEWRSPNLIEATSAGYLENDTTLLVASGMGVEECSDPNNPLANCQFWWTGGVYKFNLKTREKSWETRLSGGDAAPMFDNSHLDIMPSIERDGYIICGAGYELIPDCRTDTIDKCWSNPGVIGKISNEGDSLWLRKYYGVTDIIESNRLVDAEITPDGGYSFVGEAFNGWPGDDQGQFGWLLMTDSFGCMVPGCQLISSTESSSERNEILISPMKIYPVPASDVINVLITASLPESATIHLSNALGQEIDSWHSFEIGATYSIPVDHLAPGLYFMVMTDGNAVISTQQVLVR